MTHNHDENENNDDDDDDIFHWYSSKQQFKE